MGAAYRATDTKLKREVAIEMPPAALAADPDRLARFQIGQEGLLMRASVNSSDATVIRYARVACIWRKQYVVCRDTKRNLRSFPC